ncbi:hypothetical protein DIJ63_31475, partial [Burkholderia pseudomallei]
MEGEGGFGTHRARGGDVRARRSSQCRPRARGRQGGVGGRGASPVFSPRFRAARRADSTPAAIRGDPPPPPPPPHPEQ